MKKSTKVIATIVAVVLVVTAMVVAIYAATAGNVGINANVSWTAQEGVNLEFWATATGGDQEKSVAKSTIAPTTTNANAKIQGDLSCNFKDDSNDGVNNPGAITFKYYVKNNSLTPLNIRVTKTPEAGAESGTSASNHKPKIVLASTIGSNNVLANALGTSGCELTAGETFEYSVVLSMASGGTGTIDANTGLMKDFDAGVNFLFNVAGSSSGSNTIKTVVDGVETSTPIGDVAGQTLGEFLATKEPEISTGWFFDEELTQVVTQENLNAPLRADAESTNFYTREASYDGLEFELNSDGTYSVLSTSRVSGSEITKKDNQDSKGFILNEAESIKANSTEVIIPNKYNGKMVTAVGYKGFRFCTITKIVLANSVTSIGENAFESCSNLTNITLGNGVTSIGSCAFKSCSGLTSITIPNSVKSIGSSAFPGCIGLTSIKVSSGNTKYDSRDNCNAIIETASNTLIQSCKTTIIPNTITSIGNSAFYECSGLTSITIPNSVTSIGNYAFLGCDGLTSVTIPNSVTSIGGYAFEYCDGLTSITIGNSVTSIGDSAFESCSGLTSITIPDSVTSIEINAFSYCKKLTKIYIPASVTTISASMYTNSTFKSCSSTLKIYCEASSKPSGWGTYWNYYASGKTLTTYWGKTLADFNAA